MAIVDLVSGKVTETLSVRALVGERAAEPGDVLALAERHGTRMVDLKFTDLPGTWQHMGMALASLDEEALADGIGFDGSSIRGFQEIYESDMLLLPDPSTAVVDPFYEAPTLSLVCTVLDPITRERLQDEFLRIQEDIKKTIVFVTHDIDEAIKMGDRIAILKHGGVLAQYDAPETILANPNSEFVASFVGTDRILKRLSLVRVGDMRLEPANGEAEDLPRIDGNLTVRDALSEIIGSGSTKGVVERDGEKGLLTIDAIEKVSRARDD